jgi:hypothetical protein
MAGAGRADAGPTEENEGNTTEGKTLTISLIC